MSAYRVRIAGYRFKDGKLVSDVRRLSVSQRLRQAGSKAARPRSTRVWYPRSDAGLVLKGLTMDSNPNEKCSVSHGINYNANVPPNGGRVGRSIAR